MSILLTAAALAGAAPVATPAQVARVATTAPAPAKKECCCAKMERPMACCQEHGSKPDKGEAGHDAHGGHNMNH